MKSDAPALPPVDEAWQLYARGAVPDAIALVREALQSDATSVPAQAALGFFLLERGELEAAAAVLQPAQQQAPAYAPLHWYTGLLLLRQARAAEAAQALELACRLDPALDEAAFVLAWTLHELGRTSDALAWAQHALARARLPQRLAQTAWLAQATGNTARAVPLYREAAAALDPASPEQAGLHLRLSQCLRRLQRAVEADLVLQDALQRWPRDAELRMESAWLLREQGRPHAALRVAHALVQEAPANAGAWHLVGVLQQELGQWHGADASLRTALEHNALLTDVALRRAQILQAWQRPAEAHELLLQVLGQEPDHPVAVPLMAQVLLDLRQAGAARTLLVCALRAGLRAAQAWRLLAFTQSRRGRPRGALRTLRRALALAPNNPEALRLLGWLSLEQGDATEAVPATERLLACAADDPTTPILAALVFAQAGHLERAVDCAEHAVAQAPQVSAAWRALARVRLLQQRLQEAEAAARHAVALGPTETDNLRELGWVLAARAAHAQALQAFEQALALDPANDLVRLELAKAFARAGRFDAGLAVLGPVLSARHQGFPALQARAHLLVEGGLPGALDACAHLLRSDPQAPDAVMMALRLASLGQAQARKLLVQAPVALVRSTWRKAIEQAVHQRGHACLAQLVRAAQEDLDEDPWIDAAALYAASLSTSSTPQDLARWARDGYRGLKIRSGLARLAPPASPFASPGRVRIAYVASQLHERLLRRVLAAHAADHVHIHLFTPQPMPGLPPHVQWQRLDPVTLAASCAANAIDVVIDAGGLHPFEGQFALLEAYARRVAPVQVGWLGCGSSAGGLFDVLLSDEVAVPPEQEAVLHESLVRLDGGQWCWDPPEAPPPGPAPCLAQGHVTFGVTARSVKLTESCLGAFARIVAATPGSVIRFIGEVASDWPLRRDILAAMQAQRVAPERVAFDPFAPHEAYLHWLQGIDVVLDSFPGNGGLSLLDPLWMGVPVLTLAGAWPAARQGASILAALGLSQWIAHGVQAFCDTAVALAADHAALQAQRSALRAHIAGSALVDGRRVAAQIEKACAQLRHTLGKTAALAGSKPRVQARAHWALQAWLARASYIELPDVAGDAQPWLSVIVVLHNQAGLTLGALQALADQRGPRFETLIVDNASSDDSAAVLARVQGAHILRNDENLGFLRAARQAAQRARGRFLVFLNNDALLQRGALQAALRALQADERIGALGGRVVLTDGGLQEAGNRIFGEGSAGGVGRGEDAFGYAALAGRTTDYVSGVFLATPATLWHALDGFDERFAPAYYEDTDYCVRVWQAGYRVVYEPTVLLEHLESGSATGDSATLLMQRNRSLFAARHADWLAGQPAPQSLPLDGDRWGAPDDLPRRPRVLFLDNEVPHTVNGGGQPRARLMLQALRDAPVTLYPLWQSKEDWRRVYASLPRSVEVVLGPGMQGLEDFLQRRRGVYDVLLVSRPPNLRALAPLRARRPDLFAGMRLVYDAEALFALRDIARAALLGRPLSRAAAQACVEDELALAADAHAVLVVSERDARQFQARGLRTRILSHSAPVRAHAPGPARRRDLLFVGAVLPGTPNEDALVWFVREVMPRLQRQAASAPVLRIAGLCHSEPVLALAGPQVRLLGPQDVLQPHYDTARVFVAPSRFAGGVPAKVIEAAAAGLPVVASAVLVRQLGWHNGQDILGARDAAAFAQAIGTLLQDDEAWRRQQAAALQQCAQRYAPQQFRDSLIHALGGEPGGEP